jgi:hypothetical protein
VAWGDCANRDTCDSCRRLHDDHYGQHLTICYPIKMVCATMEFFRKRFDLHSRLYQHKTHGGVSRMICDILRLADPHFRLVVRSPQANAPDEKWPMSWTVLNARSYVLLRDQVIDLIANTESPELEPARQLIDRLWRRDLYKWVGTKMIDLNNVADAELWKNCCEKDIVCAMLKVNGFDKDGLMLDEADLFVHKVSIHCGLKDQNPVSKMRFLERHHKNSLHLPISDLPKAIEVPESTYEACIPRSFMSNMIRIYCRDPIKTELAGHVFQQWLEATTDRSETAAQAGPPLLTQDSEPEDDEDDDDGEQSEPRASPIVRHVPVTPQKRRHDDIDGEVEY